MEELDLDINNLCTTEDAFEQFQSGAMYEEDEFITLSDIVSSPHTNQDVNEILHDDPCDEVVSLSIQDEKTVNNIPPFEENEVFDVNFQTKDQNNKDKTRTSKRRGRKKKDNFENSDVQQTQCEIDLKPTKPKRRSRKSIIAADTSDLKYVEECVNEEPKCAIPVAGKVDKPAKAKRKSRISRKEVEENVKKQGKQAKQATKKKHKESHTVHEDKNRQISTSTIEDSNISTTTSTIDNKKIKHKRGRKKQKISCPNPVLSDIEVPSKKCEIKSVIPSKTPNNELENSIPIMPLYDGTNKGSQVENKPSFTIRKTIKNRVAKEKVKKYVSDEDIEDLPLSNLSSKTENDLNKNVENKDVQCTTLENKNSTDSNIHSQNNTSNGREIIVKKRGRPKKISDNSHAKSDFEVKKLTSDNTEKIDDINNLSTQENQNKFDNPEILSSSNLSEPVIFTDNEQQVPDSCEKINISTECNSQSKRNSKKKIIPDFEYNVDSVVKNDKTEDVSTLHEDQEIFDPEDSSRRPVRRRVLKNWNYDEGSDEDPYANVESSDDEPRRRKKGGRCYSDDEYFPGDKRQMIESESDIAMDEDVLNLGNRPQKKKKSRKSDLVISNKSPRKKSRKSDAESICTTEKTNTNTDSGDVDFEDCVDPSIVRGNDDQVTPTKSKRDGQKWGKTNEFENFIAKIVQGTDIKISKKSVDNVKTSLQIPVIEATKAKKNIEKSAQTVTVNTKPACVQTDTAYEIPMKDQVPLTGEQSEKACDFLSSIVQTTAELGQLMTQKSEDFINKKINTKYVTDTFKMDYCVKKSFLLFKLAKHNLVQMEEDLSKQYEGFLRENNLIQHRQEQKIMASTSKASDSDCEIVEEPVKKKVPPKAQKPAFNPKTVFLNKELSIKIAKKPTEEPAPKKKLNIKGRHSVWINDSVVVKKVKPNQSFLAQDSRNKKPPDNKITLEDVNNFFKMHERQKALFICAPFIKTEWFGRERRYMCNYFVDSTTDFPEKTKIMQNENVVTEVAFVEHDSNHVIGRPKPGESIELRPETLSLLCTKIVQNCLHPKQFNAVNISSQNVMNQCEETHSQSLTDNAVEETHFLISDINKNIICLKPNNNALTYVQPLKILCFKRVIELMSSAHSSDGKPKLTSDNVNECVAAFYENDINNINKVKKNFKQIKPLLSLLSLCVKSIQETQRAHLPVNISYFKYMPKSLKSISLFKVQNVINGNSITKNTSLEQKCYNVETLLQMCIDATNISSYGNSITNYTSLEQKCYKVKTLLQMCIDVANIPSYGNSITKKTSLEQTCYNVKTLLQLCIDAPNISSYGNSSTDNTSLEPKCYNAKTLLQLCLDAPNISTYGNSNTNNTSLEQKCYNAKTLLQLCIDAPKISSYGNSKTNNTSLEQKFHNAKTLLPFCKNAPNISSHFNKANSIVASVPCLEQNNPQVHSALNLKLICRNKITELSTEWYTRQCLLHEIKSEKTTLNFTINNVNTVSDDVFFNVASDNDLGDVDNDNYVESSYNEEEQHDYSDVDCGTNYDDLGEDDNNWVSQVQMQELRSCLDTTRDTEIEDKISGIHESKGQDSFVQIKLEPNEYQPESIDSSNIKTEPVDDHEYVGECNNYPSINIITKQEDIIETQVRKEPTTLQNSNSYNEELFESFVSSKKMVATLNDYESKSQEIFSQSSQRVRRQYEPDSEDETDVLTDTMNLLVPQNLEIKDRLMESSQEEDEEKYKKSDKKKSEKRKCKPKKNNKDLPNKGKIVQKNEVTVLTKKMKDKIRQEHDKSEVESVTEPDCLKLSLKIHQEKITDNKSKNELDTKRKDEEKVIQCNDVDSTELITENKSTLTLHDKKDEDPDEVNFEIRTDERSPSPLINFNEPVEILECEPTLPIFYELFNQDPKQKNNNRNIDTSNPTSFVDRHGWKCYPIDSEDSKIYSHAHIQLDKLPVSFTETYFNYQDGTDKTTEDLEINELTNLQSLQSMRSNEVNDLSESKPKIVEEKTEVPDTSEVTESNEKQLKKENPDQLSPSEDESKSNVFKYISPVGTPVQSSENHVAKKILMNDDSDTEKADVEDESTVIKIEKMVEQTYKTRFGRTVKSKVENAEIEKDDLMLTADKMMNKELALLHAPVDLKEEEEDVKDPINKSHNKNAQKNASKSHNTRYRIKTDDDSSSEEEKQWFTTKEKLLKRLLKKNEDTNIDDAKRAKIVSEFIEKRGELPEPRQRARARPRSSKKTLMERRKQIKILSRELFGVDTVYSKKYSPASTSKGRRNIRKVIDKKSLARSTVVANMEEFERKKRLTLRQAQLREDLGCEEGVNVVVINDELCLEYDFEEKRPVVSVHQFFTKVMKAHQYEGVKFMWDACFESVSLAGGGDAGGGCILAHCMGLGKTLQVLALLHTVLTHPQVGMRRVLVCCPLSTVLNWVDEIHKWIGPVTNHIKVFELSKLKKTYERAYQLEDWYNGGGIFIIGYELFRSLSTLDPVLDCVRPTIVNKIRTALLDPGPDIIICDEGHLLKNDCSVLAVAMSRVVTKRRIILTGTPMQNNLREYYCMVNFVKPNLLGSYSEYSNRFENPIMNGQHRDSREEDIKLMKARTHILHKVLEACLQRQEASVLYPYLPKKYEYTVFISLTKCQWELYKHYLTHFIKTKENKQSVLRDFHVLQKIWTHPLVLNNFLMKTRGDEKEPKTKAEKLDDDLEESPEQAFPSAAAWWAGTDHEHMLHQLDSSFKFLVVFQLLQECVDLGDKVLIFSTSLYAMDALEFFLNRENKWTLGREYYRLDGSVPAEVRQKWCREFNAPQNTSTKLFLISTRAGCLGLNMTAANRVIILDTSWNPAHDIQSIFRVYRFGQKKDCYIYRLVAMGTMEQKIYERSVTKQAVACRVVDEQQIDRHYNMAELSELYRLDEEGSGVSAGLAAGVRDAALLRVAAAGAGCGLHAVHEHDSLLRGSSESVLPEHERNAAWMQFQQEHATTHIRNFEINVPKQAAEDPNVRPKTENSDLEKDKEAETNTDETTPKVIKKAKRKSKTKNIEPEPQPSTSQQDLNPVVEESMIKTIMNILIKHNFHTTKSPDEISALVMNVREVVAKAPKQNLNDVDPLIGSIARVLLESENITFPEVKTKQTNDNEDKIDSIDNTDNIEMDFQERKRRRNRRDSDEEYVPNTRKRKSTAKPHTRKSNESVNSDNNYVALDSSTESAVVISNEEVLDKKPVVINLENSETLSKKLTESNDSIDDKTSKQSNKKVKIAKIDVKKEKQLSNHYETVENESLNESIKNDSNKEVLYNEPVVISSKKSETLSKKPPESNNIVKTYENTFKQSNKKVKTAKNDIKKEKQLSKNYETIENEPLNESTGLIFSKEVLEEEPVVITSKISETLSKKPPESNNIVKIYENTCKQSNKKVKTVKNDIKKEKQLSKNYETIENEPLNESTGLIFSEEVLEEEPVVISSKQSETISKKPSEIKNIVKIDKSTCKQSNKKVKISKNDIKKEKQRSNIYETIENEPLHESTDIIFSKEVLEKEPVVISLKKSETLSKKSPDSNRIIKIEESTCKQSNKKLKIAQNDVRKEKQRSNIYETVGKEPLNENTEIIYSKEVLEPEPAVISVTKSETLSKKLSESNQIVQIDEKTCIKKFVIVKNNEKNEKQRSSYKIVEHGSFNELTENNFSEEVIEKEPVVISSNKSESFSKKPCETNQIVKIDENACKQNFKKYRNTKKDVPKEQTTNIYDTIENESSNECIEVNDNCDTDNFTNEAPVQPTESISICLSDDDEPIITEPAPQNKKEIKAVENLKTKETIPLHKSVLTNKNFIKLVAHTYLSGNPMLDEDAAVLAAQYSTLKALKEVQATGKNLTSGPIHDIAVKVLGTDLMKRLFVANPNKYTAETMLLETENLQNKTMNDMLLENSKLQKAVDTEGNKKPEPDTKTTFKRKFGILRKANLAHEDNQKASQSTSKSYQETISSEATNTKVVPVGIFKGPMAPSSQELSIEECILPDDDEVIITAAPLPSPEGAQLARRNSKQLVVNTVSSKENSGRDQRGAYVQELVPIASVSVASRSTVQSTTKPSTIENSSRSKNITNVQNVPKSDINPAVNMNKNTTRVSHVTICLDSDEEDIPSFVCDKNFNKPITSSETRTLVNSPLLKNSGKNSNENNDNKKILVPVTSVNTSSSPTPAEATKNRTSSVDERKKLIKEINAPKASERKCKPGDIIRINESGTVEILKRITGVESASQSKVVKLKDDNNSDYVKKVNPPAVTYPPAKDKLAKNMSGIASMLKEDKRKDISSPSKQQNNPDPLSVLNNVVHIPAFKYNNATAPKPPVEKSLQTPLQPAKEVTVNTKFPNPKLLEVKPVITLKNTQQVTSFNDKQTIVKKMINTKSISAIKTNNLPKSISDASKEFVIDLTESQHVQIKKPSVPSSSNEVIVVSGSFKDAVTSKVSSVGNDLKKNTIITTGKTVSKVSPKSSASSPAVPSTSDSKRSSPWSEGAQSKKLKTESKTKMALRDFNLDDFDDIIELE